MRTHRRPARVLRAAVPRHDVQARSFLSLLLCLWSLGTAHANQVASLTLPNDVEVQSSQTEGQWLQERLASTASVANVAEDAGHGIARQHSGRMLAETEDEDDGRLCSETSKSATAVLRCTNAIRTNPYVLSSAPCFPQLRSWLLNPPRRALAGDGLLTVAALDHNRRMVAEQRMFNPSESLALLQETSERLRWSVLVNIAAGNLSARAVVTQWLCSEQHRAVMFSPSVNVMGVAATPFINGLTVYTQLYRALWYEIQTFHNRSLCLTVTTGHMGEHPRRIQQLDCTKADNQKFRIDATTFVGAVGYWRIVDFSGAYCWGIGNGDTADYTPLTSVRCSDELSQVFALDLIQIDMYLPRVRHSGRCLRSGTRLDGMGVYQFDCKRDGSDGGRQYFYIKPW